MNDRASGENNLGLAGFIVSLVGIVSCGLLAPVGAVMSAVAMKREPRGFAIAGLVIGIVGSLWILAIAVAMAVVGAAGLALLFASGWHFGVMSDMVKITLAVSEHNDRHGSAPASLDELQLPSDTVTDPWGNQYLYELAPGGASFTLRSAGPDGQFDTGDDIDWTSEVD